MGSYSAEGAGSTLPKHLLVRQLLVALLAVLCFIGLNRAQPVRNVSVNGARPGQSDADLQRLGFRDTGEACGVRMLEDHCGRRLEPMYSHTWIKLDAEAHTYNGAEVECVRGSHLDGPGWRLPKGTPQEMIRARLGEPHSVRGQKWFYRGLMIQLRDNRLERVELR